MDNAIDRAEVLRYLGYRGQAIDELTEQKLAAGIERISQLAVPRCTYRIFDLRIGPGEAVTLLGADLPLQGRDIYEHLRECRRCAVMAATLGIGVDNAIRVAEAADMTEAVILDACATAYIEQVCDRAEDEIAQLAAREKRGINSRFSPGYGDLPLSVQPKLLAVLDAERRLGLTVTGSDLLIPRKSVTALIGFTTLIRKKSGSRCATCSMRGQCRFRKEGITCGR